MRTLDKVAWEVLNATADDCENLEQIYRQVCCQLVRVGDKGAPSYAFRPISQAPQLSEIADHVRELVDQGLLQIACDENGNPWQDDGNSSYVWRAWFRMSPEGIAAWEAVQKRGARKAKLRGAARRKAPETRKRQATRAQRRSA
jgi:heme exporter protein D